MVFKNNVCNVPSPLGQFSNLNLILLYFTHMLHIQKDIVTVWRSTILSLTPVCASQLEREVETYSPDVLGERVRTYLQTAHLSIIHSSSFLLFKLNTQTSSQKRVHKDSKWRIIKGSLCHIHICCISTLVFTFIFSHTQTSPSWLVCLRRLTNIISN